VCLGGQAHASGVWERPGLEKDLGVHCRVLEFNFPSC
jgi:hypothetical protein